MLEHLDFEIDLVKLKCTGTSMNIFQTIYNKLKLILIKWTQLKLSLKC